ncbi:hypothetical protein Hanom_Chr11g01011611 [Helianthus anomalus]
MGKMVLPFEPLTITFQDLQYYVEPPPVIGQKFLIKILYIKYLWVRLCRR